MSRTQRKAFAIILAVAMISMLGLAMVMLGIGSGTLLYDLQRTRYETHRRNLAASGVTWAAQQASKGPTTLRDQQLDVTSWGLADAALKVSFAPADGGNLDVHVATACRFGTKTLRQTTRHLASPAP